MDPKVIKVAIGANSTHQALMGKLYEVSQIIPHPKWEMGMINWILINYYAYDYAILILKNPLVMVTKNFHASTTSLATRSYAGKKGTVSGYSPDGGEFVHLKSLSVPILTTEQLARFSFKYGDDRFLGTGYLNTVAGPCSPLDLGAPLVIKEGRNFILVGIVSVPHCQIGEPDIYGNITHYHDWIMETMEGKVSL
ncbi:chymotrypsin-1-like [Brevipalpus obovatus]|uniref:chymotrypsin-1-like n=1 Tax=Brevipalpus obovatus TaxID=246614 RepID=UPI003D9F0BE4